MCLAENRVTPRESKLLVQYVFHRGQKKMPTEVKVIAHKIVVLFDDLVIRIYRSDIKERQQKLNEFMRKF